MMSDIKDLEKTSQGALNSIIIEGMRKLEKSMRTIAEAREAVSQSVWVAQKTVQGAVLEHLQKVKQPAIESKRSMYEAEMKT